MLSWKLPIKAGAGALILSGATVQATAQTSPDMIGTGPIRPQEAAILTHRSPYTTEQVRFKGSPADVLLAGTFTKPSGKGPYPAVILLAGSGPNDRDEAPALKGWQSSGHRKFLVLADALTRAGFAVLRYDKRGVGQSTGDFSLANLSDYTADAEAALRFLKSRHDVAQHRIGLIGDSEGGFIAPMVASQNSGISFVVLLSTGALPYEQMSLLQKEAIARAEGKKEADIAADGALYRRIFRILRAAETPEQARAQLTLAAAPLIARGRYSKADADLAIAGLTSPLGIEMQRFDPRPYLRRLAVPVLVVSGALDIQIPPAVNLPAMREALSGKADVTIRELDGINHQLQRALTGAPSEYASIAVTIDPAVLDLIREWMDAHARSGPARPSQK